MTIGFRPPGEEEPTPPPDPPDVWYDRLFYVYTICLPGWMWLILVVPCVLALFGIMEFRFGS